MKALVLGPNFSIQVAAGQPAIRDRAAVFGPDEVAAVDRELVA